MAHSIALMADGALQTWGAGWEGQLSQAVLQRKQPHPVDGDIRVMTCMC
jgi:hypothetical protein